MGLIESVMYIKGLNVSRLGFGGRDEFYLGKLGWIGVLGPRCKTFELMWSN